MLKWFVHNKLRVFEREQGYDATYMHEVIDTDLHAFMTVARARAIGSYRKDVPVDVHFGASLTSSVQADCGPCTQLSVGFALRAGVPAATIVAVVRGDDEAMPPDVALAVRFARAVLARDTGAADGCREEIARRWGPRAVLSLTFAIVVAQLFPTLKYGLGYGKTCTRVVVAGQAVSPGRYPVAGQPDPGAASGRPTSLHVTANPAISS